MPPTGNIRTADCLAGTRQVRIERSPYMVTADDYQPDLVARRHDAEPARVQVEVARVCLTGQRMDDDH